MPRRLPSFPEGPTINQLRYGVSKIRGWKGTNDDSRVLSLTKPIIDPTIDTHHKLKFAIGLLGGTFIGAIVLELPARMDLIQSKS